MNTTDKLLVIIDRCKASVTITCNGHKDYYQSVDEYLQQFPDDDDTTAEVRSEMRKRDTIIHIQAYPETPIGSYSVFHYDMNAALDEMLSCLNPITDGKSSI